MYWFEGQHGISAVQSLQREHPTALTLEGTGIPHTHTHRPGLPAGVCVCVCVCVHAARPLTPAPAPR